MDRCITISQFALDLCKGNKPDLPSIVGYLAEQNNEESCIFICNVIFSYYKNQYNTSTTDIERNNIISSMLNLYGNIFNDRYIPQEIIRYIFVIACNLNNGQIIKECIAKICDTDCFEMFPATCNYIYRYCINFIVDTNIFYEEPYTTMLDRMLAYVKNCSVEIMVPDFFS